MVDPAPGPQRPETMTSRQLDRRRRVLDAVHALLAEVPVRDVQVKDIAERAGVSLAAIYNYFSSKDHLLAEALVDWAAGLAARTRRPPAGSPPGRPFTDLVRRGVRAYARAPQYAEVFLATAASADPHAIECMGRLSADVGGALQDALAWLDDETAEQVRHVIGNAWTGGLFECVHGRLTFAELERSMVTGCRLLLGGLEEQAAAGNATAAR